MAKKATPKSNATKTAAKAAPKQATPKPEAAAKAAPKQAAPKAAAAKAVPKKAAPKAAAAKPEAAPKAASKKSAPAPKSAAPKTAAKAAPKQAAPKPEAAAKAAPKKAAPKKTAEIKLTDAQANLLKEVAASKETGVIASKKIQRQIDSLQTKKLIKRGKKEGAFFKYHVTKLGEKHQAATNSEPNSNPSA